MFTSVMLELAKEIWGDYQITILFLAQFQYALHMPICYFL